MASANQRPRFFLCTRDTAGVMSGLAQGLQRLGYEAKTMVFEREPYTPHLGYDVERGRPVLGAFNYHRSSRVVRGVAWRTDALLGYLWNGLYTPDYLKHDVFIIVAAPWEPEVVLYPLLRRLKKTIVIYWVGSETRHVAPFAQEFEVDARYLPDYLTREPINPKLTKIRLSELYADAVYSLPDVAGLQVRPYYHAHLPLDVMDTIPTGTPDREAPVILHAPSRTGIKGTSLILAAVEELRREGLKFDFRMLTNVPRREVLAALRDADIVVDQVFFHGPGVLAAEAMMAGCVVAGRTIEPSAPIFQPPMVPIRPENVKDRLRSLIRERDRRVRLAREAVTWARNTFDPKTVAARLVAQLGAPGRPDYTPSFYLDAFNPPSGRRISALNRALTRKVVGRFRPDASDRLDLARARGVV